MVYCDSETLTLLHSKNICFSGCGQHTRLMKLLGDWVTAEIRLNGLDRI
jgi:hypothetical protein